MTKFSVVFLYLVPFLTVLVTGVPRQLILYESEQSNDRFHPFTSATPDTRIFPWMRNIQRICYLGSWYCYPRPDYKDPVDLPDSSWLNRSELIFEKTRVFREYSDMIFTCKNLSSIEGSTRPEVKQWGFAGLCGSFRPAGGGLDLSMDTLTLFNEDSMRGQEITISQNGIPSFPPNYTVRSLAWTGKNSSWTQPKLGDGMDFKFYQRGGGSSWSIFDETDYGGVTQCFDPDDEGPLNEPYLKTVRQLWIRSISSIKRGCESADVNIWRFDRNGWSKIKAIGSGISYTIDYFKRVPLMMALG